MPGLTPVLQTKLNAVRRAVPGCVVAITIAAAATFVSEHHGGPTLLYALLIGMAFHFLSQDPTAGPGIDFAAKTLLRIGVALLGARISVEKVVHLGWFPIATAVLGVTTTILVGALLCRPLGRNLALGVLTGGAVAICGASAALAISSVLPRSKHSERSTLFTIIAVTTFSTVAMIIYPLLVRALGFNDRGAGILLGATIHDVAQVVGAGHLISPEAEAVATYVKLLRVTLLMPVMIVIAAMFADSDGRLAVGRRPWLPFFLIGFMLFAVANSLKLITPAIGDPMPPCRAGALCAPLRRWA